MVYTKHNSPSKKSLKRRSEAFATLCPEVAQPNAWEEKEVVKSDTQ